MSRSGPKDGREQRHFVFLITVFPRALLEVFDTFSEMVTLLEGVHYWRESNTVKILYPHNP